MKFPQWAKQPRLNKRTVILTDKGWKASETGELLVSYKQVKNRIKAYLKATTVNLTGTQLVLVFSGKTININFGAIQAFLRNPSMSLPVETVVTLPATATLAVNATQQLTNTVGPASAWNKAVTYVSSAPAVATVSATGLVTAKTTGTATITIASVSNPGVTDTTVITVS